VDIGLGDDEATAIEVSWPSGARQEVAPAESRMLVVEPAR
jgi:hypothetical protein